MTDKLRGYIVAIGSVLLAGGAFVLYTPQPAARTMAELRDAGVADGQKFVLVCPERLTDVTRRRIGRSQPGVLRPGQRYATVARVAVCFRGDGALTNCFDVDGNLRPSAGDGAVVVPSLRQDADGGLNEGPADDGTGESNEADDSLLYRQGECQALRCASFDAGSPGPFATAFCSRLNRMMVVPSACAMPNCWTDDGGWDDTKVVDCKAGGVWASGGQPRWIGCNTIDGADAVGTQCVPVACGVVAGDSPPDWL